MSRIALGACDLVDLMGNMSSHGAQSAFGIQAVAAQALPERSTPSSLAASRRGGTPKGLGPLYQRYWATIRHAILVQFSKDANMTDRVLFWTIVFWVFAIFFEA
jgi:hypothetical protein